jgi:hypothetical protein
MYDLGLLPLSSLCLTKPQQCHRCATCVSLLALQASGTFPVELAPIPLLVRIRKVQQLSKGVCRHPVPILEPVNDFNSHL